MYVQFTPGVYGGASAVEKQDTGDRTTERLTKAKETLKVKSKFVVYPTEKPEFCSFLSSRILVKA